MSSDSGIRSRAGKDGEKTLSIIVPAYQEEENIKPLCTRLFEAMKKAGITAEVWIMDDESAGSAETEKIVKELQPSLPGLRIHCRKKSEGKGLSSAVLLGFEKAKYENLLCMDADLQHRPEDVPSVAMPVITGEAEMTVGSRHVAGGGLGFEWSLLRQIISWGGKVLSAGVSSTTDPMAGFFCTRKEVLARGRSRLNPKGFKIALEVSVRCRCNPVVDVPITFDERVAGESKLTAKVYKNYVEQLASLYWDRYGFLLVAVFVFLLIVVMFVLQMMLKAVR